MSSCTSRAPRSRRSKLKGASGVVAPWAAYPMVLVTGDYWHAAVPRELRICETGVCVPSHSANRRRCGGNEAGGRPHRLIQGDRSLLNRNDLAKALAQRGVGAFAGGSDDRNAGDAELLAQAGDADRGFAGETLGV